MPYQNRGYWSACGSSAEAEFLRFTGEQEKSVLEAGFMWQKLTRTSAVHGLKAEITSFVTVDGAMEVMMTELTNITEEPLEMTPIAVMPVYGRSADNIRDHRHVTSLLHRICTTDYGVEVTPAMSFDERGHQKNHTTYFVYGSTGEGEAPAAFTRPSGSLSGREVPISYRRQSGQKSRELWQEVRQREKKQWELLNLRRFY